MNKQLNLITSLHKMTKRNYLERMSNDKIHCMQIANKFDFDFWDGKRCYGYGGHKYIEDRWTNMAKSLIEIYNLKENAKILDVGCGKGFLLFELKKLLPSAQIIGFDVSEYAISNSKKEIKKYLINHKAQDKYPWDDNYFDLVLSINCLHNLAIHELESAFMEIERISINKFIVVESYKNESELYNLQCWALTCQAFFNVDEWKWIFKKFGYTGDYEFIFF